MGDRGQIGKRGRIGLAAIRLFGALLPVSACATPPGAYVDSMDSRAILGEFPEAARNCGLPEASLLRFTDEGRRFRLMLPATVYAQRTASPTAERIGCILHWADERGLRLMVQGSRR